MKKIILLAATAMFMAVAAFAQENTFNKGDKVLNVGIGLGSSLYTGSYYTSTLPPLSASYEVGILDHLFDDKSSIGVGGYVGYTAAKWEYLGYGWKYSNFILGARGAFHYQLVDKLDTYAGLILGYNIVSSKSFGTHDDFHFGSSTGSGIISSGFVGARYYFTPKIGAFAELGYGIAYLNIGVNFKL